MKTVRSLLAPGMFVSTLTLTFASLVCVGLVAGRAVWVRNLHYSFLVWNLFLAWLPLLFAVRTAEVFRREGWRNWRFKTLAAAWLLFFPNAPYIFTDVIHLIYTPFRHFWVDLSVVLICALTGLVLGFVSLYVMQSVVRRLSGQIASWLFIGAVAGLSGFGIYLGRFLRFNSWDVIAKPFKLFEGVTAWAANPTANSVSLAFPILFATFLFLAYVMLYALTHLPQMHALSAAPDGKALDAAPA